MGLHYPLDDAIRLAGRLHVTLPDGIVTAHQRLTGIQSHTEAPWEEFRAAYAACITEDRDPLADADVTALAARCTLASPQAQAVVETAGQQLFIEHTEDIFAAFVDPFDKAAEMLRESFGTLGREPLNTAPPSPKVDRARLAVEVIDKIALLWKVFAIYGDFPASDKLQLLVIADVSPRDWYTTRPDLTGRVSAWDVVCMGWTLSLASPATFRQRKRTIIDSRDAELARLEEERKPPAPEPRRTAAALLSSWDGG